MDGNLANGCEEEMLGYVMHKLVREGSDNGHTGQAYDCTKYVRCLNLIGGIVIPRHHTERKLTYVIYASKSPRDEGTSEIFDSLSEGFNAPDTL